ncbi:lipocalin family protein [Moheibacter stercoris]|uniref:Lipocalin-like domain-containing protein n=1 Tax=Moheibacter stercoris TaxID=1628251 RepID=A0ABV2LWJ4_9FLAO
MLLATLFILTGCSSDDDNPNSNSPIVGEWNSYRYKASDFNNQEWYLITEPISVEFSNNGTFIFKYDDVPEGGGTWSISGNSLTMNYTEDEWDDETINYEILVMNESTLRIKEIFDDGEWAIDEFIKQ